MEARAERDLWGLLEIFTRSNLIKDLDDESKILQLLSGLLLLSFFGLKFIDSFFNW